MQGYVLFLLCYLLIRAEWDVHLTDIYATCVLVLPDAFEVHVGRDVAVARE